MSMERISRTLATLILAVSPAFPQAVPSAARAVEHIRVLAHDSLGGRRAGTADADRAAAYIEQQFRAAGLAPAGSPPSYRQSFTFLASYVAGSGNRLAWASAGRTSTLKHDADFRVMTLSASESFEGAVVFAGYGIVAPSESRDDYAGVDVNGRAVIVIAGNPDMDNPHSMLAEHSSTFVKVQKAKEKGARAVIVVRSSADSPDDELFPLAVNRSQPRSSLVVLNVARVAADRLFRSFQASVDSLAGRSVSGRERTAFALTGVRVSLTGDISEVMASSDNVVGYLPPTTRAHGDEHLIIGAHYDHLGMGGEGSGSLAPGEAAVHNGADDNASGTGALIELARTFAAPGTSRERGILFLAFSAEELGLIGSAHYAKNPVLPLDQATAMLNMDMVGRMKDRTLIVFGMGTSEGFADLVRGQNRDSLELKLNSDGFGPSDHSSFYAQKVPVMHFFTDLHSEYHRPSDDADRIEAAMVQPVLAMVYRVATALANADDRPVYAVAEQSRPQGQMRGFTVWVGTIPDYAEQTEGMRISGVSPESPAEKAGLQGGDVMVKFGKVEIKNIYDYTYALGQYRPGDEVVVTVVRDGERKEFSLTLVRRSR